MEKRMISISENISQELIEIRRSFHKIPELSNEEYKTAKLIEEILRSIPHIKVETNIGNTTGVMGI